jgi:hypothetical protein
MQRVTSEPAPFAGSPSPGERSRGWLFWTVSPACALLAAIAAAWFAYNLAWDGLATASLRESPGGLVVVLIGLVCALGAAAATFSGWMVSVLAWRSFARVGVQIAAAIALAGLALASDGHVIDMPTHLARTLRQVEMRVDVPRAARTGPDPVLAQERQQRGLTPF